MTLDHKARSTILKTKQVMNFERIQKGEQIQNKMYLGKTSNNMPCKKSYLVAIVAFVRNFIPTTKEDFDRNEHLEKSTNTFL